MNIYLYPACTCSARVLPTLQLWINTYMYMLCGVCVVVIVYVSLLHVDLHRRWLQRTHPVYLRMQFLFPGPHLFHLFCCYGHKEAVHTCMEISVVRREVPVEQGWGPVRGRVSPCYVWEGSHKPDAADGRGHTGADQVYT